MISDLFIALFRDLNCVLIDLYLNQIFFFGIYRFPSPFPSLFLVFVFVSVQYRVQEINQHFWWVYQPRISCQLATLAIRYKIGDTCRRYLQRYHRADQEYEKASIAEEIDGSFIIGYCFFPVRFPCLLLPSKASLVQGLGPIMSSDLFIASFRDLSCVCIDTLPKLDFLVLVN